MGWANVVAVDVLRNTFSTKTSEYLDLGYILQVDILMDMYHLPTQHLFLEFNGISNMTYPKLDFTTVFSFSVNGIT